MTSACGVVTVSGKPAFDGGRQREVLTALQKASERDATAVARDVHLSYPQYNRYLWGQLPLRSDQFRTFAAAYDVPVWTMLRLLFTETPVDSVVGSGWTVSQELHGTIPEKDIPAFEDEHGGKDDADARAAARGVKRNASRARAKSGPKPRRKNQTA